MASRAPLRVHTGRVAPLRRSHVDTDQIIPKQFLKRIERRASGRSSSTTGAGAPTASSIRPSC